MPYTVGEIPVDAVQYDQTNIDEIVTLVDDIDRVELRAACLLVDKRDVPSTYWVVVLTDQEKTLYDIMSASDFSANVVYTP